MSNEIAPVQDQSMNASMSGTDASSSGSGAFPDSRGSVQGVLLKNRRPLLLVASVMMLLGFIGLVMQSADAPYRPVFTGISEQEAATVVETLQKEHIPYRLEGGGSVLVPADQVYAARLKLASQGVTPGNGVGYELFDKSTPFGISNFAQKVNLQRALQGELARTIEVLPQVSTARVHLVMTKESAFIEQKSQASASIMLQLIGGQHIPKQTILAIQNLVSASVPDLEREAVTVVDSAGNLLSTGEEKNGTSAGQTQQDYQVQLERRLEERLTGMLEQLVGAGQAVVRVTAEIDREHIEQHNKRFNPDEAVLRNQRVISENRRASDSVVGGVPGTASNVPGESGGAEITTQQPSEEAMRSENVSNYEISSTTETRTIPFGSINRLSIAAIVGGSIEETNGESNFVPRSQQELKSIRNLLERAMGYDEDRGDSLEVQSLPLVDISSHEDTQALEAAEQKSFYLDLARYGVAGLALLLLAWFVLRPMATRLTTPQTNARQDTQGIDMASNMALTAPPALTAMPGASAAHVESQNLAKSLASEDPNLTARILHQWTQQS